MAREAQLTRTWQLISMLDNHQAGMTVDEIRDELGVTERTVYRDLAALQAAGFAIYGDSESGGARWRFVDGYRFVKAVPLGVKEVAALALAGDLVGSLQGTFFADAMKVAFEKVRSTLAPEALAYARQAAGLVGVGAGKRHNYFASNRCATQRVACASEMDRTQETSVEDAKGKSCLIALGVAAVPRRPTATR